MPSSSTVRDPAKENLETFDLSSYAAVVARSSSARNRPDGPFLSDANRYAGRCFLYRGEPPAHEVARWVIWGSPFPRRAGWPGGDRLRRGKPRILLDGVHVPAMSRDDVHAGPGEKLLAQITEIFINALGGGKLRHLAGFAVRTGRDADRFRARGDRDRTGRVPFLPFALGHGRGGLEGSPFVVAKEGSADGEEGVRQRVEPLRTVPSPGKSVGLAKLGGRERTETVRDGNSTWGGPGSSPTTPQAPWNTLDASGGRKGFPARPGDGAYSAGFLADYFERSATRRAVSTTLLFVFLVVENFSFLMEQSAESIVVGALSSLIDAIRRAARDSDLVARRRGTGSASPPRDDAFGHCSPFEGSGRR